MGPTLGDVGGQGADRHAEERGDAAPIFRRQRPHSLGGRHRTGVRRPELANLSPGFEPWQLRKGEHGTTVVYADRFIPDEERKRAERDGDEPGRSVPQAIHRVQHRSVREPSGELVTAPPPVPEGLILPQAEALIAATGAHFRIGGDRAFYSPAQILHRVPRPDAYFEPINWHRTALHELGHWVGHPSRLARDLSGMFGSALYAKEELVALSLRDGGVSTRGLVPQ